MTATENDHAAVRLPPLLVYAAAIAGGVLLHELVMPLRIELSLTLRIGVTTLTALLGLILAGATVSLLWIHLAIKRGTLGGLLSW